MIFDGNIKQINRIYGTDGYVKRIYNHGGEYIYDFKCLDNYMMPFVLRYFCKENIIEVDKVFCQNGLLAKYIDVPEIKVDEEILIS